MNLMFLSVNIGLKTCEGKPLNLMHFLFVAEERTRKNEHGFSFLEAVKVHITRISIFLQTKNAQTRTDSYCGKSNPSKKRQCYFLQTQTMHNNFFIEFFPRNGGGPEGPTQAQSACPHFSGKIL